MTYLRLLTVLLLLTGCQSSPSPAAIPEISVDASKFCVELTGVGIEADPEVIASALRDSASDNLRLEFFKASASSDTPLVNYVFTIERADDLYRVYAANPRTRSIVNKFYYNAFGYPCGPRDGA